MEQDKNTTPVHLDTDKARAGTTPGVVRWMLTISLSLVILGMALIWILQKSDKADRPSTTAISSS
jgi:hypothetical protein